MGGSQFEAKGFFEGLFDFSFTTFITLKFLRLIYAIVVALIGLGALVFFFALARLGGAEAVLALILVPLGALFYLVLARIYLEIIALFFRIAENTSLLVAALPGGGPGPGSYGGGTLGAGYAGGSPAGGYGTGSGSGGSPAGPGASYGGGPGGGSPAGPGASYGGGYGPASGSPSGPATQPNSPSSQPGQPGQPGQPPTGGYGPPT